MEERLRARGVSARGGQQSQAADCEHHRGTGCDERQRRVWGVRSAATPRDHASYGPVGRNRSNGQILQSHGYAGAAEGRDRRQGATASAASLPLRRRSSTAQRHD